MSKIGNIFLALTLASGPLSAMQAPTDEARKKDIYAVYSLLIPRTDARAGNEMYLIEQRTGTRVGRLTNGIPCVVPSTHQQSAEEAVADFTARGATSITLDRSFTLPKPYQLLTEADTSAFRATLPPPFAGQLPLRGQPPMPDPRFKDAKATYSVSDVFFNKSRTLGLVFVATFCGGQCGKGEWKVFEKGVDGDWRAVPWPCILSWIA
jgi:hypothetical protein